MKIYVASQRIGILAFFGLQATHICSMEFTGSAAGARVAKASEAADGAGSMLKSQEKVELSKPYLNEGNRIKGPSAISGMRNSGKPPLSPPKDKIRVFEAQFKQTLLDRATLEKQLSQSIKNTEDYVDEMMRNMLSNVKELKSLYKEIIQGAGQLPRKDFRQAMAQLKSMLKNTPLREEILDIGELQEKAMLQVYARTVHQQIFQTIDFM
ncbi:hypothetical protein PTTG_29156, partial [Puccinia triticina 1-1 BBBD Race 1]